MKRLKNRGEPAETKLNRFCASLGFDVKQLFRIDDSLFPFGVIIRILKRRKSFDAVDGKKERF